MSSTRMNWNTLLLFDQSSIASCGFVVVVPRATSSGTRMNSPLHVSPGTISEVVVRIVLRVPRD